MKNYRVGLIGVFAVLAVAVSGFAGHLFWARARIDAVATVPGTSPPTIESEEKHKARLLADEPEFLRAEGTIIFYLTYGRYAVLGDNESATLRGWLLDAGSSGEYQDENGTWHYPHDFDIGQRVTFSGTLAPPASWCGDFAGLSQAVIEAGAAPMEEWQCFGWITVDSIASTSGR